LATLLAAIASHAVAAMAQAVTAGHHEGGVLIQLPAEIFNSENI
jgi:hypothetical protein